VESFINRLFAGKKAMESGDNSGKINFHGRIKGVCDFYTYKKSQIGLEMERAGFVT